MNVCKPNNFPASPLAPGGWLTRDMSRDMANFVPLTVSLVCFFDITFHLFMNCVVSGLINKGKLFTVGRSEHTRLEEYHYHYQRTCNRSSGTLKSEVASPDDLDWSLNHYQAENL